MLNKRLIYDSLDLIEADIDEPDEIRRALAVVRCEIQKDIDCGPLVKTAASHALADERSRVLDILADPRWLDGDLIAEKVREG